MHHPLISVVHKILVTCHENQWVNIIPRKYANNHVGQKIFCNIELQESNSVSSMIFKYIYATVNSF